MTSGRLRALCVPSRIRREGVIEQVLSKALFDPQVVQRKDRIKKLSSLDFMIAAAPESFSQALS